jgi:hypothetical protein
MCSDWIADYENIQKFLLYCELQCLDPEFSFFGPGPDPIFGSLDSPVSDVTSHTVRGRANLR